jgi:hypothetical protein
MVDYIDWKMTTFYETNKQTNQNLIIQTSDITFKNPSFTKYKNLSFIKYKNLSFTTIN